MSSSEGMPTAVPWAEGGVGVVGQEPVEVGFPGGFDEVALIVFSDANAIHDDEDDGAFGFSEIWDFGEGQTHGVLRLVGLVFT